MLMILFKLCSSRDMIAPPTFWNFEDGFKRMNYTLYNNYVLAKYQSLNR